ncbi:MAG: hypothetical protein SH817_06005 [Leptospira sp.]|nr:hypothetical protein [Leptospira sp.]
MNNQTLSLFIILLLVSCQHARVRLEMKPPNECISNEFSESDCMFAKANLLNKVREGGTLSHKFKQDYYFWGFYPRNMELDLSEVCPAGIYELHRFATFSDTLFEQLTIGIYSPRTIKLLCY